MKCRAIPSNMSQLFHVYRRTDRHDEAISRFSQFDAPNKKQFFVHFCQTQNVSITQVGNFDKPRLLGIAVNQSGNKQLNKTLMICFKSPIMETELTLILLTLRIW